MKTVLIFVLSFMVLASCVTFVFDAGLGSCMRICQDKGKIVKDFGWKAQGKIYCECKEKEKEK
ncbi:MAG: hypothetical protein IT569_05350 [Leptospiraceae bacterium]|nr:hypothetical protein [Leptospiraceae bacterium]